MNYILPLTFLMLIYNIVLGSEEVGNDEFTADDTADDSLHRVRRGLNMLRLGRGLQMLRLGKRALPMLRLGRAPSEALSNEDFQYILSLMRSRRQVPLPRYGKGLDFQYMLMNVLANADQRPQRPQWFDDEDESEERFPFFGYDLDSMPERQMRPIPRPGRFRRSTDSAPAASDSGLSKIESEKMEDEFLRNMRVAPLARYGKYLKGDTQEATTDDNTADKRAMHMLRLGRGMRMLRLGKRPDETEGDDVEGEEEKRALRLLRLGKRPYGMLRLGRGYNDDEKRALRLLRLGKRQDDEQSS